MATLCCFHCPEVSSLFVLTKCSLDILLAALLELWLGHMCGDGSMVDQHQPYRKVDFSLAASAKSSDRNRPKFLPMADRAWTAPFEGPISVREWRLCWRLRQSENSSAVFPDWPFRPSEKCHGTFRP